MQYEDLILRSSARQKLDSWNNPTFEARRTTPAPVLFLMTLPTRGNLPLHSLMPEKASIYAVLAAVRGVNAVVRDDEGCGQG